MLRALFYSLILLGLSACGSHPRAPIEDRNRPAPQARHVPVESVTAPRQGEYRVLRGDTLYSIAWRHGLDFRALAAANRIPPPYTIYPGQLLRLRAAPVPPASGPAVPPRATVPAATASRPPAAPGPAPGRASANAGAAVTKPSPGPGITGVVAPAPAAAVSSWRWPAQGQVIRSYSSTVHKGIDIAGERGDAVSAVADGVVVYAGTGIVGFGELLIVKHNDTYLSAYGHNDRLLVREGESVRAGQQIAAKGSSGTDRVKLHFEIRREGKPVDPLQLLPRR